MRSLQYRSRRRESEVTINNSDGVGIVQVAG